MRLVIALAVAALASVSFVFAEIPLIITHQGTLTDEVGTPVPDAWYPMTFRIYGSPGGSDELWSSGEQSVLVTGGTFNVNLGESPMPPIPHSIFAGGLDRYLGMTVGGGPEMSPRFLLTSSVYAYHALTSDTAHYAKSVVGGTGGWTDVGTRVSLSTSTDSVGVGTSSPQAKLQVETTASDARLGSVLGAVYGQDKGSGAVGMLGGLNFGVSGTGNSWGTKGITTTGYGVIGGTSSAGGIGVYGTNVNGNYGYLGGQTAAVYGNNAGGGYAGYFSGKVYASGQIGIGTVTPLNALDVSGGTVIGYSYAGKKTAPGNGLAVEGRVGIGLTIPNHKLYVHEKVNGLAYPIKIDNSDYHWNSAVGILFSTGGEGGGVMDTVRGKGALVYEYTNTWNRGSFHFLQEQSTDSSNPGLADAVMTIKYNGNVGIGNKNPDDKLDVNGNLEVNGDLTVNGAFKGDISGDGAPFPKAAYDSGWFDILPGSEATLTHNVGVDVNRYFIDIRFTNLHHGLGIHNYGYGGYGGNVGVFWKNLTTTTVKVYREEDDWLADQVRVRIWLMN